MAAIKRRDTQPEMRLRRALHATGFRFRLDRRDLPGSPDIVLPKYRTAIFVHGCFWHRHNCRFFKWPKTRAEFWREKLNGNVERDRRTMRSLRRLGWQVLVIWECELRENASSSSTLSCIFASLHSAKTS
ncbi:DNA mismatch endonuclease Vsr [Gemmatimonas sp.]|uniref:very short patch repair endonuclease n=1 Tax=Gemmatimonas sp. TaxID=1962908 RepID=UPI0031B81D52|nr:DNA mismatch endonuclease Vsr [Gemmatimonas sp.]